MPPGNDAGMVCEVQPMSDCQLPAAKARRLEGTRLHIECAVMHSNLP